MNEQSYIEGSRRAWLRMLQEAISQLGTEGDAHRWIAERHEVVATLRRLCDVYGDNDWPDNLALQDVIEKHLWRHLDEDQGT